MLRSPQKGDPGMTSENENTKYPSFNVVDKRRFDTSGQERDSTTSQETPPKVPPQSHATPEQNFSIEGTPQDNQNEPVAFSSFIMSLATQVLVQLGQMPAPSGMEIPVDRESARQTIDILSMLQRRTKGNLSQEESRFLEEVLHSLRISFLNTKTP